MNQLLQKPITAREVILASVGSASGAAGAVTIWTLVNKLSAEQVMVLSKDLGGYFVITLAMLVLGVRVSGQLVERLDRFVAEQAKQSSAIQTIASRDDGRAREQDAVLDHLARSHDELTRLLKEHLAGTAPPGEAR